MPNCSNCGTSLDGKPKICPKCNRPTRIDSPGMLGASNLGLIVGLIGIAVTLAAVLYPVFLASKPIAKQTEQLSVAKQVAVSTAIYQADFDDVFPPFKSSKEAFAKFEKYLQTDEQIKAARTFTWNTNISGLSSITIENIDTLWMFHSPAMDNRKRIVAFVDGHCKALDEEQFATAIAVQPKLYPAGK